MTPRRPWRGCWQPRLTGQAERETRHDSPPPGPPLIGQKPFGPPAPFVAVLAQLVLARLHLGELVQNLGEQVIHCLQLGLGDGETGEQRGLQIYAPTSSSSTPNEVRF
jgi:hypothetical protein